MALVLNWVKDLQFVAEDDKGHAIVIESRNDAPASGLAPMQLLLVAAAGCMAMDVVYILKKKRLSLAAFRVAAEGAQDSAHPRRYNEMRFVFTAVGDITQKDLDEAIRLSEEKYCSVSATIRNAPRMIIESRVENK